MRFQAFKELETMENAVCKGKIKNDQTAGQESILRPKSCMKKPLWVREELCHMLELKNVIKTYKHIKAVDGLSFRVERGDVFGLIGANGAGKSTTVSMIATLIKPDQGKILFDGTDIVKHPACIRKNLGYVPQEIALYDTLTGKDNIEFWSAAYHLNKVEMQKRRKEIMDIIGFTDEMLQQKVKNYSGGMKRRLNIGVALLHHPQLVIMDEPTAGIDIISREMILKAIRELAAQGTAILYVGHYMEEVEKICSHICVLAKGSCILNETMEKALNRNGTKISLEQLYMECINEKK